ncbi:hypothetical protein DCAR_0104796 [Daucus carota subsp. sativus]|uniref:F-box domain-containing protein n=1 Tax=Daucus carota subsp. sativus TaxID=79200 RepID=A0AAF1AML1_DAUCS|nr:hypothetical protein DCAR_0104796 [Daucus carota subsp. sativus]
MDSTSKQLANICKVDRISDLPDSLLIAILALLPIETAVRTCILSKRWRPLCESLPNLDFVDVRNYRKSRTHFTDFVDKFLMRRPIDLKIAKFQLYFYGGDYYRDRVNEWIMNALGRDLKEIQLCFGYPDSYELVQDFFYMCTGVEVIWLRWRMSVEIPENVKLLRLRVLRLLGVTFSSYESLGKLLLNCPVLEDLAIEECKGLTGNSLSICGSVLKRLTYFGSCVEEFVLRILIDTPRLEKFEILSFTDGDNDILFKENLPFLKIAEIDIYNYGIPRGVDCMFGLLKKINNVKFLTLSDRTMGFIIGHYEFPAFHNLTELVLNIDDYCHETLLDNFLQNSPNLESLKFPQGLVSRLFADYSHRSWGWSQIRVPECLSAHLKTVHIKKFNGINEELAFVKFLLGYGSSLRNVSIEISNLPKDAEARQELLNLQSESTTCKLNLIDEKGTCSQSI